MSIYLTTPYTYYIEWSVTGMKYYGVRYANGCHPSDFWVTYFTSSKYVAQYVLENGSPDIIKINHTFLDKVAAISWEHRVLKRLKVIHRADYLNKHDGKAIAPECMGWQRGLTKETHAGIAKQSEGVRKALTGRTKETHPYIKAVADAKKGLTKENNLGVAARAIKITGRTKETHPGIASMANTKSKQNKENSAGIRSQIDKISSIWNVVSPDNSIFTIKNLNQWCSDNGFRRASIYKSVKYNRKYRGYLFTPI